MGELKNIDISKINAYLSQKNYELKGKVVYYASLFNILIPFLGIIYGFTSVISYIVAFIIAVVCIMFMIYFKTKVSQTQKNIIFNFSVAMVFMSINLCYISCVFFSQTTIGVLFPLLFYAVSVPLIAFLIIKSECKKIMDGSCKKKNFANSRITYFSVFGAGLGIVISRIVENQLNDAIILGICFGALGIIISLFSGFFVKWYCYILIEKATE